MQGETKTLTQCLQLQASVAQKNIHSEHDAVELCETEYLQYLANDEAVQKAQGNLNSVYVNSPKAIKATQGKHTRNATKRPFNLL